MSAENFKATLSEREFSYEDQMIAKELIEKIGKGFGEQSARDGVSLMNLYTQVRIASALERIANALDAATGNVKTDGDG